MLEKDSYIDILMSDGAALAAAARKGLDAKIPACPGWNVGSAVIHTGRQHRWLDSIMLGGSTDMDDMRKIPVPAPNDPYMVDWFETGIDLMTATMREADPELPIAALWAAEPRPVLERYRRVAVEMCVHRWDGESAHGLSAPIETYLAADGLDEMFYGWLPWSARTGWAVHGHWAGESVRLESTDLERAWVVKLRTTGKDAVSDEGEGDVVVRGNASDLLLLVMNRIAVDNQRCEVLGEQSILDRWSNEVRFGRSNGSKWWLSAPKATYEFPGLS